MEARAAAGDLVVADQDGVRPHKGRRVIVDEVVGVGLVGQPVGEGHRQVAARHRAHHQRPRPLVGPQLDVAGRAGISCFGTGHRRNLLVHYVAFQRVHDVVGVLRAEAVEYRRAVEHHDIGRDRPRRTVERGFCLRSCGQRRDEQRQPVQPDAEFRQDSILGAHF